jgi:hypothetical protein
MTVLVEKSEILRGVVHKMPVLVEDRRDEGCQRLFLLAEIGNFTADELEYGVKLKE